MQQAQLGLGHSYSRAKVKFNVNKVDNMIIQAICLLDQLDKDLNTFAMRVREWYGWHFPELVQHVNDNYTYCKLAQFIQDKARLKDEHIPQLVEITNDEAKAQQVLEAARMSMGQDISPVDLVNIEKFATRVVELQEYRKQLHEYLISKMNSCAPNLSALIGEQVGARLISHAGSLTSLAKYPASTVQILGAEKALFRALKTKGNTPKYGLIFHSTFIGRAGPKNKGRISRYLANKCSIASRIDTFSDSASNVFGQKLRQQVEDRLEFYKSGATPKKNQDVMKEAMSEDSKAAVPMEESKSESSDTSSSKEAKKSKKDKKRKAEEAEVQQETEPGEPVPKKQKKDKKSKSEAVAEA
jgi:nucleolar protein 56